MGEIAILAFLIPILEDAAAGQAKPGAHCLAQIQMRCCTQDKVTLGNLWAESLAKAGICRERRGSTARLQVSVECDDTAFLYASAKDRTL
ncbi:hypothetical protein BJ170DRAFT_200733 [Xylariales sp. AK1849]|nr:hypothetical protein BJ170DRAFT_200733 [Xylariales sp. AK1849]